MFLLCYTTSTLQGSIAMPALGIDKLTHCACGCPEAIRSSPSGGGRFPDLEGPRPAKPQDRTADQVLLSVEGVVDGGVAGERYHLMKTRLVMTQLKF